MNKFCSILRVFGLLCFFQFIVVSLFEVIRHVDKNAYASASISDFNFVAVGDWGCTPNTVNTVTNTQSRDPELVISLGDFSYEETGDCWFQIVDPIDEKMKITIGNHDDMTPSMLNQYMNHFNLTKQFYSFNYRNIHFTAMSNEVLWTPGSEQHNFVTNDLSTAAADPNIDWIIVFTHKPVYKSPNFVRSQIDFRDVYHPLFDRYGVDLVLQGHDHNYQRTYPLRYNSLNSSYPILTSSEIGNYSKTTTAGGQIYALVGTGGVNLHNDIFDQAPYVAVQQASAYGILNIDIINNGQTLVGTFYANDGYVDDRFVIDKAGLETPANLTTNR